MLGHINATDLPKVRDDLLDFAASTAGHELRKFYLEQQHVPLNSDIGRVVSAEAPGLAEAMLIYADHGMCELAVAAAQTLPEFSLDPDDPPSPSGLLWFATPVEDIDSVTDRLPFLCVAVGWVVRAGYLWITTYIDRDAFPWIGDNLNPAMPYVVPMGVWPAPMVDGEAEPVQTEVGRKILATVKAMWLLMRQPLTEVTDVPLTRAARRRIAREGRVVPEVRTIGLRRHEGTYDTDDSSREWQHRWLVRGHWRMQPFGPNRERVRPVWIAPHIKGPEGLPMLGGEKVYLARADPTRDRRPNR